MDWNLPVHAQWKDATTRSTSQDKIPAAESVVVEAAEEVRKGTPNLPEAAARALVTAHAARRLLQVKQVGVVLVSDVVLATAARVPATPVRSEVTVKYSGEFNATHSTPLFAMPWRRHGYTAYITF